eukprot:SAG22_NODE_10265_length_544_cov_1.231461_1_plen_110_part_10
MEALTRTASTQERARRRLAAVTRRLASVTSAMHAVQRLAAVFSRSHRDIELVERGAGSVATKTGSSTEDYLRKNSINTPKFECPATAASDIVMRDGRHYAVFTLLKVWGR